MLLFWLMNAVTVVLVYAYWIRPILQKTPKFSELYAREGKFFSAFSGRFAGIKQRLTAAFIYLSGILVVLHDYLAPRLTGVNFEPIFPKIVHAIPPEGWPLVGIAITGLMDWFRFLNDKRLAADAPAAADPAEPIAPTTGGNNA